MSIQQKSDRRGISAAKVAQPSPAGATETPKAAVTVVEPTEPTAPLAAEAPPVVAAPAPTTPVESLDVRVMRERLAQYVDLMSAPVMTDERRRRGAAVLSSIANTLAAAPKAELIDVFLTFHIEQRDGLMDDRLALRGAESLTAKAHMTLSVVYALFRKCVLGTLHTVADGTVADALRSTELLRALRAKRLPAA